MQQQQEIIKSSNETLEAAVSEAKGRVGRKQRELYPSGNHYPISQYKMQKCANAMDKVHTPHQFCLAKDATCFHCNRKGHYSAQCLSKTVAEIDEPLQKLTLNNSSGSDFYSDILHLSTVNEYNKKLVLKF